MPDIDFEAMAKAEGWREGKGDHGEAALVHDEQDRIWPVGDWEGALRDLGFEEDDPDWIEDIIYLPEKAPGL